MKNMHPSQMVKPLTIEVNALDEKGNQHTICIPAEHPLTIYLDEKKLVTLLTMGANPEKLVLGYLYNQRYINTVADIASIETDWIKGTARVHTNLKSEDNTKLLKERHLMMSCAQGVSLAKWIKDKQPGKIQNTAKLAKKTVLDVIKKTDQLQIIYKQARSVHACALFSLQGELLYFVEDVGRHNAIDTIAGCMCHDQMSGENKVFYVTGRFTSEMVMKGIQMGIPFLLSRAGASGLGYQLAKEARVSLLIRCLGERFQILTHPEQVLMNME